MNTNKFIWKGQYQSSKLNLLAQKLKIMWKFRQLKENSILKTLMISNKLNREREESKSSDTWQETYQIVQVRLILENQPGKPMEEETQILTCLLIMLCLIEAKINLKNHNPIIQLYLKEKRRIYQHISQGNQFKNL